MKKHLFSSTLILSALLFAALPALHARDAADNEIDALDLNALMDAIGKKVVVRGIVTRVGTTPDGKITFLNFGNKRDSGFVAIVFEKSYPQFSDGLKGFSGKEVRVSGVLELYKNQQPQIVIHSASQVQEAATE
jgi:DNA/RNA endonuclease YhcR with UshA esterase domain